MIPDNYDGLRVLKLLMHLLYKCKNSFVVGIWNVNRARQRFAVRRLSEQALHYEHWHKLSLSQPPFLVALISARPIGTSPRSSLNIHSSNAAWGNQKQNVMLSWVECSGWFC